MEFNLIVILRIVSSIIFLFGTILFYRVFLRIKDERAPFLLFLSAISLIGFLESLVNSLEWANILPSAMDILGEYLMIILLILLTFIAFNMRIILKIKLKKI